MRLIPVTEIHICNNNAERNRKFKKKKLRIFFLTTIIYYNWLQLIKDINLFFFLVASLSFSIFHTHTLSLSYYLSHTFSLGLSSLFVSFYISISIWLLSTQLKHLRISRLFLLNDIYKYRSAVKVDSGIWHWPILFQDVIKDFDVITELANWEEQEASDSRCNTGNGDEKRKTGKISTAEYTFEIRLGGEKKANTR